MVNTVHTRLSRNSLPRRLQPPPLVTTLRSVGQDNPAPPRARTATPQPASLKKDTRSHPLHTDSPRTYTRPNSKRKTVQLALWVKPVVKAELERVAETQGLSVSSTGAAFLEQALQQNLHTQHEALLDPIIEKAIAKHLRSYSTRIAMLLVRVAFDAGQTRNIVTNILGRQQGVTPTVLTQILNSSSDAAKGKITRSTPQLEELIAEVELWFTERDTNTHA